MGSGGPRPGAGRKRKSPALKQLRGTDRPDREVALPGAAPTNAPMIAPIHLSEHAQLIFTDLAKMLENEKRASPHFAQHVAMLALRLEQIQRWQAVLEMEGDTYASRTTKKIDGETIVSTRIYARPEVAMLSDAMRQAQSLIAELMLNPSAALRIASGRKPEATGFEGF
jgi:phage terminase small subunit